MNVQEIIDYMDSLRQKCIDEAEAQSYTIDALICVIRKYNREWNELATKEPLMKKDGFSKCMKNILQSKDSKFSDTEKKRFDYL